MLFITTHVGLASINAVIDNLFAAMPISDTYIRMMPMAVDVEARALVNHSLCWRVQVGVVLATDRIVNATEETTVLLLRLRRRAYETEKTKSWTVLPKSFLIRHSSPRPLLHAESWGLAMHRLGRFVLLVCVC